MSNATETTWKDMFVQSAASMGFQRSTTYITEAFGGLIPSEFVEALQSKLNFGYFKHNNPKLISLALSEIETFVTTVCEVDNVGQWETVKTPDNKGVLFFWNPANSPAPTVQSLPSEDELDANLRKSVQSWVYDLLKVDSKIFSAALSTAWTNRSNRPVKVSSPMRYCVLLSNVGWVAAMFKEECIRSLLPLIEANSNINVASLTASFEVLKLQTPVADAPVADAPVVDAPATDAPVTPSMPSEDAVTSALDRHVTTGSYSFDFTTGVKPVLDGDKVVDYSIKYKLSTGVGKTNRWSTLSAE